jgi:hypothetical protein
MRRAREGVSPAIRPSNRKTTLEWRERLPLDFGRWAVQARGRCRVASARHRR